MTKCSATDDVVLHNNTVKFVCENYSYDFDIYKHGFITTNGSKYFVYPDRTPFLLCTHNGCCIYGFDFLISDACMQKNRES